MLQAALRLLDKAGVESLSMRELAGILGVEAMSLYKHVANNSGGGSSGGGGGGGW